MNAAQMELTARIGRGACGQPVRVPHAHPPGDRVAQRFAHGVLRAPVKTGEML